jgi:hypothetical protein
MAVTILEALQNAHFNLVEQNIPGISDRMGKAQLTNAVELLNKGYGLDEEVEPLFERYGSLDAIPDKS